MIKRPRPHIVCAGAPRTSPVQWPSVWLVGLDVAGELRRHFPQFYQQHVAQRPVTAPALVGCAHALLSLVNTVVELADWATYYAEVNWWGDPVALLTPDLTTEAALAQLSEADSMLAAPPLATHGLWHDNGDEAPIDPLLLGLWRMASHTGWSVGSILDEVQAQAQNEDWAPQVLALPTLPALTPMRELCAALSEPALAGGPADTPFLGQLVAMAFRQTGNSFADISPGEAMEGYGYDVETCGLDWDGDIWAMGRLQRAALRLHNAFFDLSEQIRTNPSLLEIIAERLMVIAEPLAAEVQAVDRLMAGLFPCDDTMEDETYDDDYDYEEETEALAAEDRAALSP